MTLSRLTSRTFIAAPAFAAAFVCGSLFSMPAMGAETEWKMHIVLVPSRPEAQAYQQFVDIVNERAAGELQITLFSSSSLGINDADMLRILPRGNIIQAAGLYPGYLTRDKPDLAYTLPPGVVMEPETLQEILPQLRDIYEVAYDVVGINLLGFVGHAVRDTHIMCKEPVSTLEDLRGIKLRVWEQYHVDVFEKLGVSAQIIGQNDLYMAMQTGVVDCAVYPIGLAVSVSLQEVAPYASYLFPYVLHPWNLIVADQAFDTLPAHVQQIVAEAAEQVEEASFNSYLSGENDEKSLEKFRADGGQLLDPFPEADQKAFAEVARKTWEELSTASGAGATQTYNTLSQAIE